MPSSNRIGIRTQITREGQRILSPPRLPFRHTVKAPRYGERGLFPGLAGGRDKFANFRVATFAVGLRLLRFVINKFRNIDDE